MTEQDKWQKAADNVDEIGRTVMTYLGAVAFCAIGVPAVISALLWVVKAVAQSR